MREKNKPPGISNMSNHLLKNLNKKVNKNNDKIWFIDKSGKKWLLNKESKWKTIPTSN